MHVERVLTSKQTEKIMYFAPASCRTTRHLSASCLKPITAAIATLFVVSTPVLAQTTSNNLPDLSSVSAQPVKVSLDGGTPTPANTASGQTTSSTQKTTSTQTTAPTLNVSAGSADSKATASVDPSGNKAGISFENQTMRLDFGVLYQHGNGVPNDTRLRASLATLYAAAQAGTYIGVDKGSELEKFVVAQGFQVGNGKVQLSAALLRRVVEVYFDELGTTELPKMRQTAVGLDYTRPVSGDGLVQEIKTSLAYYDVGNKDFGILGTDPTNAAYYLGGAVRGGEKILAELGLALKAADTVRLDITAGEEHVRYNAMYDVAAKTKNSATGSLGLTWQPDANNRFSIKGRANGTNSEISAKYEHDFGRGFSIFIEGGRIDYTGAGLASENHVQVGLNFMLDGKSKKIAPLFGTAGSHRLSFTDLTPNSLIATDTIQVMEKITYRVAKPVTNRAPRFAAAVNAQSYIVGTAVSVTLPAASDADGDTLIYSVNGLPSGLNFDASTRQITGTPTATGSGTVTYGVADSKGGTDRQTFTITINAADTTSTIGLPTVVAGMTTLTITNNIADADGVQNITYYVYSDAGGTALVASNTTGSFTGLTAGTAYWVKTTAETKNGTTNAWSLQTSALKATSTLVVDTAPTVGAPGVTQAETGLTVTNNIADADGVQNITYYVYSDAGGTTQAATPNTTGAFTGLTEGTNYWVKTTAETKNGTTNAWSLQTSPLQPTSTLNVAPSTPSSFSISHTGSNTGYTNSQTVELTIANVSDPSGVYWYVSESSSAPAANDAGWSSTKPTAYTTSTGNGTKTVYVYTRDNSSNKNVQSVGKSATIILDTTAPDATLPNFGAGVGSGSTTASSVTLTDANGGMPRDVNITADNGASITYIVEGAFGSATTFNLIAPVNSTGAPLTVTLTYQFKDQAGNAQTKTQSINVAVATIFEPIMTSTTWPSISWDIVPGATSYTVENVSSGQTLYTGSGTSTDVTTTLTRRGDIIRVRANNLSESSAWTTFTLN